jgi:hypothetical protein
VAHETPAIGFLKQLLWILQGCTVFTGFLFHLIFKNFHSWNPSKANVSILQSITTHLDTLASSQSCVSSLLLPFC